MPEPSADAEESNAMDLPSVKDLARMRDVTVGNIDFDVTDEQLHRVWRDDPHLVALAREWTWSDTKVRDQLCARLEELGAQPLAHGQSVIVGLWVDVALFPHRRSDPQDRTVDAIVGELTDLVENTIVRSDSVRAAGAAVVVSLVGSPDELPPFTNAAAAVIVRLDVKVTTSRWPATATPTLSEQVRAAVATELGALEQTAGARIQVDVFSLAYAPGPDELPGGS